MLKIAFGLMFERHHCRRTISSTSPEPVKTHCVLEGHTQLFEAARLALLSLPMVCSDKAWDSGNFEVGGAAVPLMIDPRAKHRV